jgi:prevent-host-death family protein
MRTVGLFEAKTKLSELVEAARGGEETIISVRGVPTARLVPVSGVERVDAIDRLLANEIPLGIPVREAIEEGRM